MATLNIGGRRVTVDDSFLKASPAEQNSIVEEIAAALASSPEQGVAKGGVAGSSEKAGPITHGVGQVLGGLAEGAVGNASVTWRIRDMIG